MASPRKVIVFGPTGAVGSSAARTASELGATVVLAMRDTSKPIPGLSAENEKKGNFTRVTADLTKPDTIESAIKSTGSKIAFIYLMHRESDAMRGAITALKNAGIEFVVFLSSFTVRGELASIASTEFIPYWHAQVELSLIDIFGKEGFVAVRPGSFASNNLRFKAGIQEGKVLTQTPDTLVDNIVPEDIGRVAGTVLAKGVPEDGSRAIYLYGPELSTQADTIKIIARVLGKEVEIEQESEEDAIKRTLAAGWPENVAKYAAKQTKQGTSEEPMVFGYSLDKAELKNVEKYSGRKATTLEEYVEANKSAYSS